MLSLGLLNPLSGTEQVKKEQTHNQTSAQHRVFRTNWQWPTCFTWKELIKWLLLNSCILRSLAALSYFTTNILRKLCSMSDRLKCGIMLNKGNFSCLLRVYTDNLSFTGIYVYQTRVKCYIRKVYLGGMYSAVTDPFALSVTFCHSLI